MKGRIFVVVILVVAAAFAGRWMTRTRNNSEMSNQKETRQSFRLDAGARVEVRDINGSVEIKTAETEMADVRVVRTANSTDDLESGKVFVEQTSSGLVVRGENNGGHGFFHWLWSGGGHVRQQVVMTVPRRVELLAKGVNGPVSVGEVDGSVEVEGVNGRVEVAQSFGHSEIRGVNGNVRFGVSQLGAQGMDIKGVNGNIEIRLKQNLDADIEVKGNNGNLTLNLPNVTMQERESHSNVRARLGAGGAPIDIKGVNGNIRFESDAPAAPATASVPAATTIVTTPGTVSAPVPPPPPPVH
jgi:DUF4097 and DUF4098 domain-containing protein YvlB